ncbi:rhomboid family intramembrane serine protease [Calidithermus timidus]|jgi:membrane associated rhomboid family serine protease|uniref:rhomboid family intramembrane serine protease n=1 Tax=Calidithermus timidus TaxID=307124 RepID=UPI000370239A|nr:rhomboid family intramembrane serine protease [Calidithermus timidus]
MFPLYDINRPRRRAVLVPALVVANLLAFVWEWVLNDPGAVIYTYGFIPANFFADPLAEWPTLFTSMFLHGGIGHLVGNMWFLWVFGDNVEDRLGHGGFLLFYLLGGVGAALTQGLVSYGSDAPMIGASGAISAVLGAYIVLYPGALIVSLLGFFPILIPAVIYLGLWFLLQLLQSFGGVPGVAFWAHIGGFIVGVLLIRAMAPARWRR